MCLNRKQVIILLCVCIGIVVLCIFAHKFTSTPTSTPTSTSTSTFSEHYSCCSGKKKEKKGEKKEKYHYISFSDLSQVEKATRLAARIQQAYNLYMAIKNKIPQIKQMYATVTDWDKLKAKMCIWANDKKLISGLVAVINKRLDKGNLSSIAESRLRKVRNALLKLQGLQAALSTISGFLTLIPNVPNEVKIMVDVLSNLDNSILQLFSAAGVQIC